MAITQLPTPVPSRADPANFAARADAFLGALPTFVTEANALADEANASVSSANNAANVANIAASSALSNAQSAAGYAGAQPWVANQSYVLGAAVYSPINFRIYRRKSAGSSNTDPSIDSGNWQLVNSVFSDENGNVGIGTTVTSRRLNISGSAGTLRIEGTSVGGYVEFLTPTTTCYIGNPAAISSGSTSDLAFYIAASERMRIGSNGNVGVGESSPISRLHVASTTDTVADFAGSMRIDNLSFTPGTYAGVLFRTGDTNNSFITAVRQAGFGGKLSFAVNNGAGAGSLFEAMSIDLNGNLALGPSNAAAKLDIGTPSGSRVRFDTSNPTETIVTTSNFAANTFAAHIQDASAHVFRNSGSEVARISSSNHFLRGQTASGNQNSRGFYSDAIGYFGQNHQTGDAANSPYAIFGFAGATIGSITQSGTTGVTYNTTSDYRLKFNQTDLQGSGDFIDALKPKKWLWADGTEGVGFIAHEVQEVSPSSVIGEKDAVDEDGKPVYQNMEYGSAEFIANIILELQSLRKRVADLESKA